MKQLDYELEICIKSLLVVKRLQRHKRGRHHFFKNLKLAIYIRIDMVSSEAIQ